MERTIKTRLISLFLAVFIFKMAAFPYLVLAQYYPEAHPSESTPDYINIYIGESIDDYPIFNFNEIENEIDFEGWTQQDFDVMNIAEAQFIAINPTAAVVAYPLVKAVYWILKSYAKYHVSTNAQAFYLSAGLAGVTAIQMSESSLAGNYVVNTRDLLEEAERIVNNASEQELGHMKRFIYYHNSNNQPPQPPNNNRGISLSFNDLALMGIGAATIIENLITGRGSGSEVITIANFYSLPVAILNADGFVNLLRSFGASHAYAQSIATGINDINTAEGSRVVRYLMRYTVAPVFCVENGRSFSRYPVHMLRTHSSLLFNPRELNGFGNSSAYQSGSGPMPAGRRINLMNDWIYHGVNIADGPFLSRSLSTPVAGLSAGDFKNHYGQISTRHTLSLIMTPVTSLDIFELNFSSTIENLELFTRAVGVPQTATNTGIYIPNITADIPSSATVDLFQGRNLSKAMPYTPPDFITWSIPDAPPVTPPNPDIPDNPDIPVNPPATPDLTGILGLLQTILDWLRGFFEQLANVLNRVFEPLFYTIGELLRGFAGVLNNILDPFFYTVGNYLGTISNIYDFIISIPAALPDVIYSIFSDVPDFDMVYDYLPFLNFELPDLRNRFPFSIPWDIWHIYSQLALHGGSDFAPIFHFDFTQTQAFSDIGIITLDMQDFVALRNIIRFMLSIIWALSLIKITLSFGVLNW